MWSRRLATDHRDGPIIEVNLTPIRGRSDWDKEVKPIVFRNHCTRDSRGDKNVVELPEGVVESMVTYIGEKLTKRLLNDDLLAEIDTGKLRRMPSGGAPLNKII